MYDVFATVIEPTDEEVIVAGMPCRVWKGTWPTTGLPFKLFVAKVETTDPNEPIRAEIRPVAGPSGG